MNKISLLLIFFLIISFINAQVVITSDDMPEPGDTARTSMTIVLDGIDYIQTGPGYTWDFSSLIPLTQQIDTFISVSSTPVLYQAVFNNQFFFPDHKATVARKLTEFSQLPGFEVTDTYQFLKNNNGDFKEVGYGVTLAGVPIPIAYNQIDTLYRFPLQYGNADSSVSSFEFDLPDIGYFGNHKTRKNTADGWGTLITPYGTFETLRLKTEIVEYDSLYVDSLGVGFPVTRNIVEYKWLSNDFHVPVLTVNEENSIATATYLDSARTVLTTVKGNPSQEYSFRVYPNPGSDFVSISYELFEESAVSISLYSIYGNEVKQCVNTLQDRGLYTRLLYPKEQGIKPGIYLLRLTVNYIPMVKRVMIR